MEVIQIDQIVVGKGGSISILIYVNACRLPLLISLFEN